MPSPCAKMSEGDETDEKQCIPFPIWEKICLVFRTGIYFRVTGESSLRFFAFLIRK